MTSATPTADPATPDLPEILTRTEAARWIRTSVRHVECLLARGQLRSWRSGGRRLIRRQDLLDYVAARLAAERQQ